ncbi:hypothetical protein NMY22_g15389 [Coprinellus aureogranulatus]|nr:hypothetical protein NMY22_g15389 [Coprinellus aureogranulatus]
MPDLKLALAQLELTEKDGSGKKVRATARASLFRSMERKERLEEKKVLRKTMPAKRRSPSEKMPRMSVVRKEMIGTPVPMVKGCLSWRLSFVTHSGRQIAGAFLSIKALRAKLDHDKPNIAMSPIEDREFNFCYPVPDVLQNHRVKLVPFVLSIHLDPYFAASKPHPEVYKYLPWGPFPTTSSLAESIQVRFQQEPGWLLFAIFDKMTPSADGQGSIAGIMSYQYSSPANLCTEIGSAIVLPAYQRTHVATNAVGLLLNYALNLPSHPSFPGLGLRRVVWQANFLNEANDAFLSHLTSPAILPRLESLSIQTTKLAFGEEALLSFLRSRGHSPGSTTAAFSTIRQVHITATGAEANKPLPVPQGAEGLRAILKGGLDLSIGVQHGPNAFCPWYSV